MLKRIIIICLILIPNFISSFETGQVFSYRENWSGSNNSSEDNISGIVKKNVHIIEYRDNEIKIQINMEMTPFSQIIEFQTVATKINDKYCFSCEDNWGNEVEGYIFENCKGLYFYIDIINSSMDGKNLARLYGDKIQLTIEK